MWETGSEATVAAPKDGQAASLWSTGHRSECAPSTADVPERTCVSAWRTGTSAAVPRYR